MQSQRSSKTEEIHPNFIQWRSQPDYTEFSYDNFQYIIYSNL